VIRQVVLDTNVFVAAGFNPRSHAARLLAAARGGALLLAWHLETRAEVLYVLGRIPPLRQLDVAALFRPNAEYMAPLDRTPYGCIPDPADRPPRPALGGADLDAGTGDPPGVEAGLARGRVAGHERRGAGAERAAELARRPGMHHVAQLWHAPPGDACAVCLGCNTAGAAEGSLRGRSACGPCRTSSARIRPGGITLTSHSAVDGGRIACC